MNEFLFIGQFISEVMEEKRGEPILSTMYVAAILLKLNPQMVLFPSEKRAKLGCTPIILQFIEVLHIPVRRAL